MTTKPAVVAAVAVAIVVSAAAAATIGVKSRLATPATTQATSLGAGPVAGTAARAPKEAAEPHIVR